MTRCGLPPTDSAERRFGAVAAASAPKMPASAGIPRSAASLAPARPAIRSARSDQNLRATPRPPLLAPRAAFRERCSGGTAFAGCPSGARSERTRGMAAARRPPRAAPKRPRRLQSPDRSRRAKPSGAEVAGRDLRPTASGKRGSAWSTSSWPATPRAAQAVRGEHGFRGPASARRRRPPRRNGDTVSRVAGPGVAAPSGRPRTRAGPSGASRPGAPSGGEGCRAGLQRATGLGPRKRPRRLGPLGGPGHGAWPRCFPREKRASLPSIRHGSAA